MTNNKLTQQRNQTSQSLMDKLTNRNSAHGACNVQINNVNNTKYLLAHCENKVIISFLSMHI